MKILQINKGSARSRFDQLCEQKNSEMPIIEVSRTIAGKAQTYQRRKKAISDGAQTTGKALILTYSHHYRTKMSMMPDDWYADSLPSLPTNGEKLAGFRQNVTSRTIRNHIRELKAIGLITEYKFHGSKHDFELWLNPAIIFGAENADLTAQNVQFSDPETTQTPHFSDPQNTDSFNTNGTNFPHRQSIETNGNKSTTICKVENTHQKRIHSNGNTASSPKNMPQSHGNGISGGGAAAAGSRKNVDNTVNNVDNPVDKWKNPIEPGKDYNRQYPYFQKKIFEFWKYASKSLWSGVSFTSFENLLTLDQITDGIYRPFINLKPNQSQFIDFQSELMKSIDVAVNYYKNHPDQYPGDPYSITASGRGYFDKNNSKGFNVARNWRLKNHAKNHEDYGRRLINLAMLHLDNHPKGKAPKHLQIKTFSEVVDYYVTKFKNYSPETQKMFAKRLQTLSFRA